LSEASSGGEEQESEERSEFSQDDFRGLGIVLSIVGRLRC
jgi:hypothetical protein